MLNTNHANVLRPVPVGTRPMHTPAPNNDSNLPNTAMVKRSIITPRPNLRHTPSMRRHLGIRLDIIRRLDHPVATIAGRR